MKLYYVANARMPNEKAHGIQIAKMCEAFIEAGADLTLVVPNRKGEPKSVKDFYKLRVNVPTISLPVIDWYLGGKLGYLVSSVSFMLVSLIYLLWKRIFESFVVYTVDLDNYSSSHLAFIPAPLFSEMHGSKKKTLAQKALFSRLLGVFAINKIIADELKENFPSSPAHYLIEPNGVDLVFFKPISKKEARAKLGIPEDEKIILYAGRFFGWKGLEIIPDAAKKTPGVSWYLLGGDRELFSERLEETGLADGRDLNGLVFIGGRPFDEMPLWLSASDAVFVLGTKRDIQSYRYTSPMKIFEYLASGCAIIAADTPAIREIVSDKEVFWYEPDNPDDLALQVNRFFEKPESADERKKSAYLLGQKFSWSSRADRILRLIKSTVNDHGK